MEMIFVMSISLHIANSRASEKVCSLRNDATVRISYIRKMAKRARPIRFTNWHLRDWMETLRVRQADMIERTGWSKTTMSLLYHNQQDYSPRIVEEAALALNLQPFELLMHPADAMAMRRVRDSALQIAAETRRDYFSDCLSDVAKGDWLETLASLYAIIGIQALCTCSCGYSQGDYAEMLIVATPESMAAFGWPKAKRSDAAAIDKDLRNQAKLYGQWAWGDCYGYVLERAPIDDSERDDDDAWQEVDSCWGFYGDDANVNGMADYILPALAYVQRQDEAAARLIAGLQEAGL